MSLSNQINCSEAEPRATGCRQAFCGVLHQLEEQERAAGRTVDLADGEFLIILPLLLFREVGMALSRCRAASAKCRHLRNCQAAATAVRHVVIAAARSVRCVWAEMRWRWTLKVLWTAACVERNFWAEPGLLNRCILRSRRRVG